MMMEEYLFFSSSTALIFIHLIALKFFSLSLFEAMRSSRWSGFVGLKVVGMPCTRTAYVSAFKVSLLENDGSQSSNFFLNASAWLGDSRWRIKSLNVCLWIDFTSTVDLLVSLTLTCFAFRWQFRAIRRRGVVISVSAG